MRRRDFLTSAAAALWLSACASRRPSDAPYDPNAYAFLSPADSRRLGEWLDSKTRAAVIRFADRALDRTPHPMARIHTEGTLPHHGIRDESTEAKKDWPMIRDLALAARVTGDAKYADKTVALLVPWLDLYRPSYNPIDENGFDALFIAFDLLPEAYRADLGAKMQAWMHAFAAGYLGRMPSLKGGTATNNWQSHRIKIAALAAFGTGDTALIEGAKRAYVAQLGANIKPDGLIIDFLARDALHYVVYDLEPLLMTTLAAQAHGADWYGIVAPTGSTLARAVDWLVPYADGTREHEEFKNTTVTFDITRKNAGVGGFEGMFDPKTARWVYALAARHDGKYRDLARKLQPGYTWVDGVLPL